MTTEIGASVAPGGVVELNVPMLAPGNIGDYLGAWAFLNSQGHRVDIAAGLAAISGEVLALKDH